MLNRLLQKSIDSSFYLWMTNRILWWKIPFNAPHAIRISEIDEDSITLKLPFKRRNKNHINSIHACALATACEYVTGLQLARGLGADKYRLILREIKMEYLWQAKMEVSVHFRYSKNDIQENIIIPLQSENAVIKTVEAEVKNKLNETICRGTITWQIKKWENVKTKK
jgi:acyl-coenzyme A thioesterase PaaI-like protein